MKTTTKLSSEALLLLDALEGMLVLYEVMHNQHPFIDARPDQARALVAKFKTPRGIVCYDNGGATLDRYTVYYLPSTGHKANAGRVVCVGMNARPFHPQGIGLHGEGMLGRHNGKRIAFHDLPADCQKLVWQDLSP